MSITVHMLKCMFDQIFENKSFYVHTSDNRELAQKS